MILFSSECSELAISRWLCGQVGKVALLNTDFPSGGPESAQPVSSVVFTQQGPG